MSTQVSEPVVANAEPVSDFTPVETPASRLVFIRPPLEEIKTRELMWGLGVMMLWFCLFVIGIIVPAMTLFSAVWSGKLGFWASIGYSFAGVSAYALTNPLFLMCTTAILGGMAHRWQVSDSLRKSWSNTQEYRVTRFYLAAMLRGFFAYLMFVAGFLIVSTQNSLENITYDQYVRIAGMVSILGFVVGYDPNLLVRFIHKIIESMPGVAPEAPGAPVAAATSDGSNIGIPATLDEAERKAARAEEEVDRDD